MVDQTMENMRIDIQNTTNGIEKCFHRLNMEIAAIIGINTSFETEEIAGRVHFTVENCLNSAPADIIIRDVLNLDLERSSPSTFDFRPNMTKYSICTGKGIALEWQIDTISCAALATEKTTVEVVSRETKQQICKEMKFNFVIDMVGRVTDRIGDLALIGIPEWLGIL